MKYLEYPHNYIISRMCTQEVGQCQISHRLLHVYKVIIGCFLSVKEGFVSLFLLQPCCCVNLTAGSAGRKAQRPHHEGDCASDQAVPTKAPLLLPSCEHEVSSDSGLSWIGVNMVVLTSAVYSTESSGIHGLDFTKNMASKYHLAHFLVHSCRNKSPEAVCYSPCPSSRIWLNWLSGQSSIMPSFTGIFLRCTQWQM